MGALEGEGQGLKCSATPGLEKLENIMKIKF